VEEKQPNCLKCRHYFITWDPYAPRGCKIFGFKSERLPCQIIQKETGNPCFSFEEKKAIKETRK